MNKVTKVADNGEVYVAVLVSTDYGAGWYTWNTNYPQMLFDPIVVNYLDSEYGSPYDKDKYDGIDAYLAATYERSLLWRAKRFSYSVGSTRHRFHG
jgi:hypothetical protein